MAELKVPKIATQEAHDLALGTWGLMCDGLMAPMVEKYGFEKALEMLRPYLEKLGESAPLFAEAMGIEGNDAMTIATIFCLYEEQVLKVEGKVTEVSPDRVVKQSTKCPFQNLTPGFCWAFTIMAQGMTKAINPEFEMRVTHLMTEGDSICEWVVVRS
ncbi:MAG: hypothetical protein FJZ95_04405 [Chloroflexi bacterium]|nr:hypothetical protein [Chloroflexota bacterium]